MSVRRPDLIKPYNPAISQDELPPDYMAILSLLFGLIGLLLKLKIFAWIAMFFCVASVANIKKSETDFKQIVSSCTFALMGLFMNYSRRD